MFMYYDTMIGCYENNEGANWIPERRSFLARLLGM